MPRPLNAKPIHLREFAEQVSRQLVGPPRSSSDARELVLIATRPPPREPVTRWDDSSTRHANACHAGAVTARPLPILMGGVRSRGWCLEGRVWFEMEQIVGLGYEQLERLVRDAFPPGRCMNATLHDLTQGDRHDCVVAHLTVLLRPA